MSRPTVGLACIMLNEAHNLGPMLQSVRGCFDQIIIVDTGSKDNSVGFVEKINKHIEDKNPDWSGLPIIQTEHFAWVNDFSKAREYSFSFLKTDYAMWMDLDDALSSADTFIKWRDNIMHSAHYWMATYNYAFNPNGEIECQFIRERVVKLNYGFKWKYFVHEGLLKEDGGSYWPQRVSTWWINHRRTEEDKKQDYMRNVSLIEKYKDVVDVPSRMKFYHGKELVENGFSKEGAGPLLEAIKSKDLDIHDRILAIQYAALSAVNCQAYDQAIDLITNGLKLMMSRAEYWCLLGDAYLGLNKLSESMQSYTCALSCKPNNLNGIIVVFQHAYDIYPKQKLCELNMNIGNFDEALKWLNELKAIKHSSVAELEPHLSKLMDLSIVRTDLPKTNDIIITCPPRAVVQNWDENSLKEKGHGGSETAAIEVARFLKLKTNKNVKIFHPRVKREKMGSGVEYIPSSELAGYLQNVEPYAHIAWRHAVKLTNANSYVWCHDLQLEGGNMPQNYDKVVALSEFHREYLKEVSLVPENKISLGFNGVDPKDFDEKGEKDPLKVIFSSSPDRGLVQSIDIVRKARDLSGLDIKLHCFYGTDNLRKMGQEAWAESIENTIKMNSEFVVYHGMVNKKELAKHFKESAVWIYPADFIETYCITAIEAMCASTWPIVRRMGALPYTLKDAIDNDMCTMLNEEAKGEENITIWAKELVEAVKQKKWKSMNFSANDYSWEKVADFFIKEMNL